MSKLTKAEKLELKKHALERAEFFFNLAQLKKHALERAEFFFNLAQSDPSFAEIAETTSWEWLFVYATGDYLG